MTRKGGFLKGIVTSAATYAVKTAVDIAVNPGEHAEGGAACQRATGRQQTQAGRREHASACRA